MMCELKSVLGSCGNRDTSSGCLQWPCVCGSSRNSKMVEVRDSKAYFFEDNNESDDQSTSDLSPLIRRPCDGPTIYHTHIITGYLSIVELIFLVTYSGSVLGFTLLGKDYMDTDKMVAFFSMIHVGVWILVGIFDRIVQWRHQTLRRKGYLKFYRRMRNIRRVPFVIVSVCNAALLLFMSLLYFYNVQQTDTFHRMHPVILFYVIIGLEMMTVLPCLVYYIALATIFNYQQHPPDVIQETLSGPQSPTASTAVGFRDADDLDELLERQADMIRYLQQHNANLGRRILELQTQTLE